MKLDWLENIEEECEKIKTKHKKLVGEFAELEANYDALQNQHDSICQELQTLSEQKSLLSTTVQELNEAMLVGVSDTEVVQQIQTQNNELVTEREQLLQEITQLKQKYSEAIKTKDMMIQGLESTITVLQNDIGQLKSNAEVTEQFKQSIWQEDHSTTAIKQMSGENVEGRSNNVELESKVSQLLARITVLETDNKRLKLENSSVSDLAQSNEKLLEQNSAMEDSQQRLEKEMKMLQRRLTDLQKLIHEGSNDQQVLALQVELEGALQLNYQNTEKVTKLTKQIEKLREERDLLQHKLSNTLKQLTADLDDKYNGAGGDIQKRINQLVELTHSLDAELDIERVERLKLEEHILHSPPRRSGSTGQMVPAHNLTISRDNQSTPEVLMNWMWGRSTPRVVNV